MTQTSAKLSWDAFTDNVGVTEYKVTLQYYPYTLLATTSATSVTLTGLDTNTSYSFKVVAYDAAGNSSSSYLLNSVTTLNTTTTSTTTSTTTTTIYVPASLNSITYTGQNLVVENQEVSFQISATAGNRPVHKTKLYFSCSNGDINTAEVTNTINANSSATFNISFNLSSSQSTTWTPGNECQVNHLVFDEYISSNNYFQVQENTGNGLDTKVFEIDDRTDPYFSSGIALQQRTSDSLTIGWAGADNYSFGEHKVYVDDSLVSTFDLNNATSASLSYQANSSQSGQSYMFKVCLIDLYNNEHCEQQSFSTYTIAYLPSLTSISVASAYDLTEGDSVVINYAFNNNSGTVNQIIIFGYSSLYPPDPSNWSQNYYEIFDADTINNPSSSGTLSMDGANGQMSSNWKGHMRIHEIRLVTDLGTVSYFGDVKPGSPNSPAVNSVVCNANPPSSTNIFQCNSTSNSLFSNAIIANFTP